MLMRVYVAVSLLLVIGGAIYGSLLVDGRYNTKLETFLLRLGAFFLGGAAAAIAMLALAVTSEALMKTLIFIFTGE